jgi:ArsR family transcriptional regulator, arsenate/arsenite/antimonite-responsive transcriptional repressor
VTSDENCRTGLQAEVLPESDERHEVTVQVLKALAHPIRLRIMQVLAEKRRFGIEEQSCCASQEVCVCRLNELFSISAPTLSHHLKLLREAGLIEGRRQGVWIYYYIRPGVLQSLAAELLTLEPDAGGARRRGLS